MLELRNSPSAARSSTRLVEQIDAVEPDRAFGDFIIGAAGDDIGQVDLPEPFGPMIAATSPSRDFEREAVDDFLAGDGDMEVLISSI